MMHDTVKRAVVAAGGVNALAKAIGIRGPSIYSWTLIPPARVKAVSAATGLTLDELRPDLFERPAPASERPAREGV